MLVEETGDVSRTDVFPAFKEASGEDGYSVGMGLDEIGHDLGELDLILKVGNTTLLVWKDSGKGMNVIVVYAGDMRVGYDDEWKVSEGLDTVSETNWK